MSAGGRCEFDGCNEYVLEHQPTGKKGVYAERAHIYPFSELGPRGHEAGRPTDIDDIDNLMVLCPKCHKEIDTAHPGDYPVSLLRQMKKDHEDRVFWLTDLAKDRGTVPIIVIGRIGDRIVDVSDQEMQEAVAPSYLRRREKIAIDLASLPDTTEQAYFDAGKSIIDRAMDKLERTPVEPGKSLQTSVFGLAPIPLLAYLGSKLSDKYTVELYNRHRAPETWCWRESPGSGRFVMKTLRSGVGDPALLLNLSGRTSIASVEGLLSSDCAIYELTLDGEEPSPLFLNTRSDLHAFTREYISTLGHLRVEHEGADWIHVFPAVPAPIAITIGRTRLPKVDIPLAIYDRDHRVGGFYRAIDIVLAMSASA